ncbi:ATPase, T2SS/T4P/T4SS family [Denitratisoma oestradiolicum]|uniref:Secretion system protein E n=1 Tax=Denitratisoma oestradiolicum TaxID=311182 RepID=A0A6S6Y295_9PROT|nr:ATPase, T2SS/T4P/T4SS family [Denitratisoma oestradiolicum]TWO80246.1 secretion system protein E [Denitratisoma oestradiolicum]CAB1369336.1 Secretion system protein E [Denitratisoma oestradiolicum]
MNDYSALFTGKADASPEAPATRYRLLIVDDEPGVVKALTRVFHRENYEVVTAASGAEGLQRLGEAVTHLVISDYMMPAMNGAHFLRQVKERSPDTIRIMLTGHADTGAVLGAINEGAVYKFILKPWNDDDLRITVGIALEQFDLVQKNRLLSRENAQKAKEISALTRLSVTNRSQLGFMLNKKGLLSTAQIQELVRLVETRKEPMIKLLLEKGWVSERAIRDILKKDLLIEEVHLKEFPVDTALAELIPHSFCERQLVVPLRLDGRTLMLAMADPLDAGLISDVRFTAGLDLNVVTADAAAIQAKIEEIYGDRQMDFKELETLVTSKDPYEGIEVVIEEDDAASLEDLLRETEEPPAIRLVNAILLEAIRLGASDIHIQPRTKSVVVRYRIDGVLVDKIHIPHQLHQPLVSRLKIMSQLDISERRRPQDGRITVKTPLRIVDLRMSTLPTINGEKVVMRILDRNSAVVDLSALGFSSGNLALIEDMAARPQGMILATGPTGSGKTTTLYSLLQHNANPTKNYVTIEDPVEYYLDMAGQVLVREKIGLTFPLILRSLLRQDPDVMLLGEIRDFETAEVAFHAALTGHQVFSTLHTNSAVATIARLFDLGLKPYVVASALEGIIAQRLVRRICPDCREEVVPDARLQQRLGSAFATGGLRAYRGKGCGRCNGSGYQKRLGIYEVLGFDDELRNCVSSGASILEIGRMASRKGMHSLVQDAAEKVTSGDTDLEEVLRVLGPQAAME